MVLFKEKSTALMTVIAVIFILTILSSVILNVLSNQTRIIEHSISRTKAKYANEAAMVREIELLRKSSGIENIHRVSGRYDSSSQFWDVNVTNNSNPSQIQINFSTEYDPSF